MLYICSIPQSRKQRIGHAAGGLQHLDGEGGDEAPAAGPAGAQASGVVELLPLHEEMLDEAQHQAQLQGQAFGRQAHQAKRLK